MQNAMNIKPSHPSRVWLLLPLLVFALVALTIGIVAHQTVRSPYTVPFFHLFFSDFSAASAHIRPASLSAAWASIPDRPAASVTTSMMAAEGCRS